VASGRDDDALTWEGDDDPTLDVGDRTPPEAAEPADEPATLPEGWNAVGKGSETVPTDEAADTTASGDEEHATDAHEPMGNVALVTVGILGGIYLLFTIGWLIGGFRLQGRAQYLVADVMFQGSFWLAVLAPLLWFATVFLLTRRSSTWVRIVWLVAGAILLVPWPFIMVGAVGQ
jgi:hypothetical protein